MQTSPFANKSILITGGTGSFGKAFAKRLLKENLCHKVIIFSRDEWKQSEMQREGGLFSHPKIRYFLGDIRDPGRLRTALSEVDIVIHAAALKQVPAAEYNPTEFIKTNIIGTMNVVQEAVEAGVEKVLALSTDKAVNPINLYGATKLAGDKLVIAANSTVGKSGKPLLSLVRYGNVLGSRGSVLPFWQSLIASGASELPITSLEMSRFWITLPEAVQFVYDAASKMQGGEIFVPKIPTVRLKELAKALAPNLPLKEIGIREGEKLHELLISPEEARFTLEFPDHYLILPPLYQQSFERRKKVYGENAKEVSHSFRYSSEDNVKTLNKEHLISLFTALSEKEN